MRRSLTYADAVRILGGGESTLIKRLDTVSSVGLLAVGGFNFFEARGEIIKLGVELVRNLSDRVRGLDRLTRTERLHAAHTVIVITAYFEAVGEFFAPLGLDAVSEMSASAQVAMARGGGDAVKDSWRAIIAELTETEVGEISLYRPRGEAMGDLLPYYRRLSTHVGINVSGLAWRDETDRAEREGYAAALLEHVPHLALGKYEEQLRQLATDCVEFRVWVSLGEHDRVRREIHHGLADLETLLLQMGSGCIPDQRRTGLVNAYRSALDRPITLGDEVTGDLKIPTLGEGYVDHRFQVAELDATAEPSRASWWKRVPIRSDVHRFLAGYLTGPRAQYAPLLVLGHPGSGKSVLTRVLAARLPASDFLVVRVELRQSPAEADLQDQIEAAVRAATGESLAWPRLVESAAGALPVVILDGFDELLQATGVSHTDFLLKVATFQEREAAQGRAVAVIVTSRIAVADRAAVPGGAVAVRLQPFDEAQISAWLDIWHRINDGTFAMTGRTRLPVEVVLAHRELAEQPLLLLMLVLFDAHSETLRNVAAHLGRTELYEQLLVDFARREVRKDLRGAGPRDIERAVESELLRLSAVAFAMFNRRSQWVTSADLDSDLTALLGTATRKHEQSGFRAPLSAAETMIGRFFFVHESQASRDGRRLQTYEFLHSTFSEYLVARLVVRVLIDLVNRRGAAAFALPGDVEDGLAFALLSFEALTARAPVVEFLADLISALPEQQRATLSGLLLQLHARALHSRTETAFADYEPRPIAVTKRHAAWSANLVLLAMLTAGQVTASELFPDRIDDPAVGWHDQAVMWRAQLSSEEFYGLTETIALARIWVGNRRDVRLWRDDGTFVPPPADIYWTYSVPPDDPQREDSTAWSGHTPPMMDRKRNFTTGKSDDILSHALEPVSRAFPAVANILVPMPSGRWVSATHALLAAVLARIQDGEVPANMYEELAHATRVIADSAIQSPDRVRYVKAAVQVLINGCARDAATTGLLAPSLELLHSCLSGHRDLFEPEVLLEAHFLAAAGVPSSSADHVPPDEHGSGAQGEARVVEERDEESEVNRPEPET